MKACPEELFLPETSRSVTVLKRPQAQSVKPQTISKEVFVFTSTSIKVLSLIHLKKGSGTWLNGGVEAKNTSLRRNLDPGLQGRRYQSTDRKYKPMSLRKGMRQEVSGPRYWFQPLTPRVRELYFLEEVSHHWRDALKITTYRCESLL